MWRFGSKGFFKGAAWLPSEGACYRRVKICIICVPVIKMNNISSRLIYHSLLLLRIFQERMTEIVYILVRMQLMNSLLLLKLMNIFFRSFGAHCADRKKIFIYIGNSSVRTNVLAHARWPTLKDHPLADITPLKKLNRNK